jgi:hypothetical protein
MHSHIQILAIQILNTIHLVHVVKELENLSLTQTDMSCASPAQSLPEEDEREMFQNCVLIGLLVVTKA